jgi:WD40 repeat protein
MQRGSPSLTTCRITDCTFSTKSAVEVKWSPEGAHLAIASSDKMVRIAQLMSGDVSKPYFNISFYFVRFALNYHMYLAEGYPKYCSQGDDDYNLLVSYGS